MSRPLDEAVRRQRERRERGERESRRSIGKDLAQIGVLGWTVVLTTLLGIFAGRWLDRRWERESLGRWVCSSRESSSAVCSLGRG